MNKKFIRLMSVLLSVMVLFTCAISASAAEKIDVTVRVEGIDKNLADKELIVDKSSTVKDVIDAAGLGLGINNNLIGIKFDDTKLTMEQTAFMGIEASLLFIDVLQDAGLHQSRNFSFTSPLEDYSLDGYNTNWTIFSAGAYFIAGGSVYIGLDIISLCNDLSIIYLYD